MRNMTKELLDISTLLAGLRCDRAERGTTVSRRAFGIGVHGKTVVGVAHFEAETKNEFFHRLRDRRGV